MNNVMDANIDTYLYMAAGEGGSTENFLRLVHGLPLWDAQDKSSLVRCCCNRSYPVTSLPSPMDTFTRIQEVQLHHLYVSRQIQLRCLRIGCSACNAKNGREVCCHPNYRIKIKCIFICSNVA